MKILNLKIKDREYELIIEEDVNVHDIIEDHIAAYEVAEFYSDIGAFHENYIKYDITEDPTKKLWIYYTHQSGWDTYDSSVVCAYTENQAINFFRDRLGDSYIHNNMDIMEIGVANDDISLGEVISSFNAG